IAVLPGGGGYGSVVVVRLVPWRALCAGRGRAVRAPWPAKHGQQARRTGGPDRTAAQPRLAEFHRQGRGGGLSRGVLRAAANRGGRRERALSARRCATPARPQQP